MKLDKKTQKRIKQEQARRQAERVAWAQAKKRRKLRGVIS